MKNLRLLALSALMLSIFGCESIVDDLNVNPNEFTEVPAELSFNHVVLNLAAIAEAEPARVAGMWSDQFAGTDRQYITQDRYGVDDSTFDEPWADLFQQGITQAQIAEANAELGGNAVVTSLSRGLQGYYAAEAALMFGDIPFSQVNNREFDDPEFESQSSVLMQAIALLREAANGPGADQPTDLSNPTLSFNEVLVSSSTWGQFFNALSARYLLAMQDYEGALAAAEAAGFDGPANSVDIFHSTTNFSENLFYQFEAEQRTDYLSFGNVGTEQSTLYAILSDTTSRTRTTDDTDDSARLALFVGGTARGNYNLNTGGGGFFAADANFPVIGYPEVQLIIAEAAARTDDEDTSIEALNNARNYWDIVTGTDSYNDLDSDDVADEEDDDDGDSLLRAILIEKYASVFGLPTYYDILRTNNFINADMDSRDAPAQRFVYPATELASNSNAPAEDSRPTIDDPTEIFED